MNHNGRLAAFAGGTIEVNPSNRFSLERIADLHDLRIGCMGTLKIVEELEVIGVRMIGIEPRRVGTPSWYFLVSKTMIKAEGKPLPA